MATSNMALAVSVSDLAERDKVTLALKNVARVAETVSRGLLAIELSIDASLERFVG